MPNVPFPENNKPADNAAKNTDKETAYASLSIPSITLPKGGGAIKSIDEKFLVNAINGTSGLSIPFPFSPSRNGFMPQLGLSYNSGSGNGLFGLGWNAEPPSIKRKTEKKLPEYNDAGDSDIFIFSGADDLVPSYIKDTTGNWVKERIESGTNIIVRYKPRIESGFARIEKITAATGDTWWKVTSGDNIISIFGKSQSARIADPKDETKIFKWLLEFSYDDKGNCFQLVYKKEDKANVVNDLHEKNRFNDSAPCTNTYLKKIKYCNKAHFKRNDVNFSDWENSLASIDYLFELVLDYGEHDLSHPQPNDQGSWLCRPDAFSEYRSGFDIRTWRLCRRVLMFHHFPELGTLPCLVRSLDLNYESGTVFTFLKSAIQKGYTRKADGNYSMKSLPLVEFTYETSGWNTEIKSLPRESLEHLPGGLADPYYQWMDLYGEGIPGILSEQATGWYYKTNLGNGNFSRGQLVSSKPALNGLSTGALHFRDVEANGQQQLVSNDLKGYFELTTDDEWEPFQTFHHLPNIDIRDPNLKFLDLDGDGRADMLISEDHAFIWYASKGKAGFDDYRLAEKEKNEEKGPNIVFADSTQSVVLADMSGDGLMDIVRIRNSEIVYWPNLGYGKFGAKIAMSHAPVFDHPDHFNPHYLKLADLNGAGYTDIVYLGKNLFTIYFNQNGNSWSKAGVVQGIDPLPFPAIDAYSHVTVIDLLGNGTGCIVWSSPLPQHARDPLRYIDLMNGRKPFVMTGYKNNMGKEVHLQYKPSTYFYLEDKKAGTHWITKLPFPVQCVSEVVMLDRITQTRFMNQYTYHHGYYDFHEREFRGFGRVDQTDTERFEQYKKHAGTGGGIQVVDEGFYQPPVLTKTWFHTGAFMEKEKILNQFAHEYYQNDLVPEKILEEPVLPGLSTDEYREALRVCKGLPLRVELYSRDGSPEQFHPYTTAQHTCQVQLVQPQLKNKHAVFIVLAGEALTYTYERNPADPRIAHSMTIETDQFGNVLKAAAISYGRKTVDNTLTAGEQAEQNKTHIVFTENNYTNTINTLIDYRLPLVFGTKNFELTGITPGAGGYYSIPLVKNDYQDAVLIPYQQAAVHTGKEKRLIEEVTSLFLKNDMSGPLAPGVLESLALPYQSFKLALTPALVQHIFGDKLSDALLTTEGKYVKVDNTNYWIASGTQILDADNFYQVIQVTDPFGHSAQISYDAAYRFFVEQTTDPLGNTSSVLRFNFRTLSPYLLQDINDNRAGVRTDELGMVVSTFLMGKAGENKGDLFDEDAIEISANDQPGSRLEYDLLRYVNTGKPNMVKVMVREAHHFDNKPVIWQEAYAYSDGGGQTVMNKVQAEPGMALQENEDGTVTEVDTTPNLRWVGNGRTMLNNKGKPVKQYEPYFSTTFEYEDAKQLVERGVTPVIHYDSLDRAIKTDLPNGTFTKVVIDAWTQQLFDPNDTVTDSQWYKDRILTPVTGIATPLEIAAANKAAVHANTPAVAYLDSLGRNFLAIADNGTAGKYKTRTEIDLEGNLRKVTDARGNPVMQYKYDMLGNQLCQLSMDVGELWVIHDVMGRPLRSWDSRQHIFRNEYDTLNRPVKSFVRTGNGPEINFERIIYGESLANAKQGNHRGKPHQLFDAAGVMTNLAFDFKGNPLQSSRQLCREYKNNIDWNTNPVLETVIFQSTTVFDALNRPVALTTPDNSSITPSYNVANLLEKVAVKLRGSANTTVFVNNINYDAKGQRQSIVYGNDTQTTYSYDKKTFRLTQLLTTGKNGTDLLQKLQYTYDPVGNITHITDEAQQAVFFNNTVVNPSCDYIYDAIYQLINASGREHIGQNQPPSPHDETMTNLPMPGDGAAMRNYTQQYEYDVVGNILRMVHAAGTGSWTRTYQYETSNNRLRSHIAGSITENFTYDEHGSILSLAHLGGLNWNFKDQLQQADLGGGGIAYYVYDAGGQRTRKVIERQGGIKEERIYLGGFELYRKTSNAGTIQEATETLHVMDDTRRIAMVETKTIENGVPVTEQLIRYQYSNHLGSSSLELDDAARIISYEEYHPYGTTAYQAKNASIKAAAKRYRYTCMERDEESGLAYHSARYYLPWLGRWLSADPIGMEGGMNLYAYVLNNPLGLLDANGTQPAPSEEPLDGGEEFIFVEGKAPPPEELVLQKKVGSSYYTSADEMHRQEYVNYMLKNNVTPSQIRKYHAEHPEAESEYTIDLIKRHAAYYAAEAKKLEKGQRIMNTGNFIGNVVGGVVVAAAAVFAGPTILSGTSNILRGGSYTANTIATSVQTNAPLYLGAAVTYGVMAPPGAPDLPGPGNEAGAALKTVVQTSGGGGGGTSIPITKGQVKGIVKAFKKLFGKKPEGVHLVGSHADKTANASSDIDLVIETTIPNLEKNTGAGFDFFKSINPGRVPEGVTGIGPLPGQSYIGDAIPKAGTIDPFFRAPGDFHGPSVPLWTPFSLKKWIMSLF